VAAAGTVRLPDLGDGHHVQRVVDAAISGPRQPVPDLLAGGGVDGCGAVVGGELILRREPVDGLDLGQDAAGDHGADAVEGGQVRASGFDEFADLGADALHLRVERPDVVKMLSRQLQAHLCDGLVGPQLVQ
jgi:hypothetical protein